MLELEVFKNESPQTVKIVGITRVRNESFIVDDTLDHWGKICDVIIVLDDCSDDDTLSRVKNHPAKVGMVLSSKHWDPHHRTSEETRHRSLLLEFAKSYNPEWVVYFDADERVVGDLRAKLLKADPKIRGFRLPLFDAYLSPDLRTPLAPTGKLEDLKRLYGPERRDILFAWRNDPAFFYWGIDQREPQFLPATQISVAHDVRIKHFGKGISVEQWEETCAYYAAHFPEPYKSKWNERRGKAIHTTSDFGTPLYNWEEVFSASIITHPAPLPKPPSFLFPIKKVLRKVYSKLSSALSAK